MKLDYTIFDSLHNPQGAKNTASWADVCRMLQDVPAYASKAEQPLIKMGVFEGDSRGAGHGLTNISGIEIDYDAGKVTPHSAAKLLRQAGIECVVCSTFTSSPDCPKWRVFAPTSRELPAELRAYLVAALDSVLLGIAARESYTAKQTFFFGRNPESNYVFMHLRGEFVDVALKTIANAAYTKDKREKAEREQLAATTCLRAETQRNRKAAGRLTEGQISPITAFSDAHDVRSILKAHGYRESGKKFVSSASSSGMAGVVILQGDDGRERAFSHHSNDPIADGLAHDAFDLFCILDHGGDEWAAIQAAAKLLITANGESLHSHNRNAYRQAQQAAKAQAALDKLKGVAV
ncbi:hypothetical protein [Thiothrix fructosivorans]|uniref:Uncharacterized protein n=1 Tax=Thiothrix fructosivorans TaxID=111770 RepID=A0A8B0SHP5_9GAMM|nr:hypothetical protein [Thiothrix fructosivorans]MBO0613700.1 hypothetical protein [Thiothrix fructosivorans]QTX10886.1 hypothetical protein J1836_000460 [Thiothrix fructosivorans]